MAAPDHEYQCYKLAHGQWNLFSTSNHARMNPTAITMQDGVYLFGGTVPPEDNSNFSEFLAKKSQTWTKGPKVPYSDYDGVCGVKISEH